MPESQSPSEINPSFGQNGVEDMIYRLIRWFVHIMYRNRIKAAINGWAEYTVDGVLHCHISTTSLSAALAFIHANQYGDPNPPYKLIVEVRQQGMDIGAEEQFSTDYPDIGAWSEKERKGNCR